MKFSVPAAEKGTAFRRCSRTDLKWIFTVQTERIVAQDNTVTIGDRGWQIGRSRFRNTLAGCTVTIHEHLDETVSIRFGPHTVGHFDRNGRVIEDELRKRAVEKAGAWKAAKTKNRFSPSPTLPWKSRRKHEIPTFPPRRLRPLFSSRRSWRLAPPKTRTGQIVC